MDAQPISEWIAYMCEAGSLSMHDSNHGPWLNMVYRCNWTRKSKVADQECLETFIAKWHCSDIPAHDQWNCLWNRVFWVCLTWVVSHMWSGLCTSHPQSGYMLEHWAWRNGQSPDYSDYFSFSPFLARDSELLSDLSRTWLLLCSFPRNVSRELNQTGAACTPTEALIWDTWHCRQQLRLLCH